MLTYATSLAVQRTTTRARLLRERRVVAESVRAVLRILDEARISREAGRVR